MLRMTAQTIFLHLQNEMRDANAVKSAYDNKLKEWCSWKWASIYIPIYSPKDSLSEVGHEKPEGSVYEIWGLPVSKNT